MAHSELSLTRGSFEHEKEYWTNKGLREVTEGAVAHARLMAARYEVMAENIMHKIQSIEAL